MAGLRVLALTRYGDLGASSRVRILQYIPLLGERGVDVTVSALLDNRYVQALYGGRRMGPAYLAARYFGRLRALLNTGAFHVLWVEKELLPFVPAILEGLLRPRRLRVVIDYDDAIFVRYQEHPNPLVRGMLGGKIARVMRAADCVVAGNRWLADYARDAGARSVEVLPSVVDPDRYRPRTPGTERITVGWIGSPATVHYLERLRAPLAALAKARRIRLLSIGAQPPMMDGLESEFVPWSEAGEAAALRSLDVGLMPLAPGRWERGKCGYKLIQYMACGVPAVASAVGANCDIINHGVDGFLAQTDDEWVRCLERLLVDDNLYAAMAGTARRKVEEQYSVRARVADLAKILGEGVREAHGLN